MIHHDSRLDFYRAPFGAQPAGTAIALRLTCSEPATNVILRLWWDDAEILVPMAQESEDTYRAEYTLPDHPGLLWYYFVIEGDETRYYGNAWDLMGGAGGLYEQEPPSYQITVYDPAYETPEWMQTGIMYHIMVDRFHASKPVTERPAPYEGHWHMDWHEPPSIILDPATADNLASDFFGGDLRGIEQKLPYLRDLGVTVLYLSPIFQARSNHKYNTGDYMRIDPSFGTEDDFNSLCSAAASHGIRVMLDGVFSHTGSDSRYFNRNGSFDSVGAYQSQQSPYYSWYDFAIWPDAYDTWWGFQTLPVVNKRDGAYLDYILRSDDSAFAHWLRAGAGGWRLDVADELPMDMLREMRQRLKREDAHGALLGEVWEDASHKVAYDELRSYCLGDTLDSAMNYPFRDALFDFLLYRADAAAFVRQIDALRENYPPPFFFALMNLIGSHDKARAINVLSDAYDMEPLREHRSAFRLDPAVHARGRARLLLATSAQMAMPGMPSVYYGDEAGVEGMADPFCWGTYPWGREDSGLIERFRAMTRERHADEIWTKGALKLYAPHADVIAIARSMDGRTAICLINRSDEPRDVAIEADGFIREDLSTTVEPMSSIIIK